jgi:YjjG family noncanonical pyrimidine nucleotidase
MAEKITTTNVSNNGSRKYRSIFFDLDHTLWDYELNSRETLGELFLTYKLNDVGIDADKFCLKFREVNVALWDLYDTGRITSEIIRQERFKQILTAFGAYEEKLCDELTNNYVRTCPTKCNLMPGAAETLEYLSHNYKLTVITNGFEEIQNTKLSAGNLHRYFDHVVTSQKAGHRKPAREIFEYALKLNGTTNTEAIMIGDNPLTDIAGAKNASIDCVLFNPENVDHEVEVHYEIANLTELQRIL